MKYVDIVREHAEEPPLVSGSRKELVQAILNISLNASQAMHGHGRLTLRTETNREYVIMRISDTGPGIGDDDMPHIFDPFSRLNTAAPVSDCHNIPHRSAS